VSDETLMLCVQEGDFGSFEELVARYEGGLYGFLRRYTGDSHLAEDLFQDCFLHVLERRDAFDPERGFRPWLYSIAANLARDAHRRRAVRSREAAEGGPGRPEGPSGPDEEAEAREELGIVRRRIAELPEDARAMVLLHFQQGLRYREIADVLGVPVGTVKSRVHWAVERLAREWGERSVAAAAVPGGRAKKGS
jgi:RNA polymerase sigma-70 factor (ECF subfamily)